MHNNPEQYRLLFDLHPHPMWVYDAETLAFLDVNDAAVRHYGYSREEFLAMTVRDIQPSAEVPRFAAYRVSQSVGYRAAGVWRHRKKDGTLIDVEVTVSRLTFSDRPVFLVLADDVTERKRLEAEARKNEQRLRAYLEAGSEAIVVVGLNGLIEFVNAKTEELFGYPREELIGQNLEILLPERYRAAHIGHRTEYAHNPRTRPMGLGLDLTGRRKNGVEFPVEVGLSALPVAGGVIQIALVNDITVRKRAEQAVRESEQRFRNLVETTADLVWQVDENGRYTYVSPQVEQMLGFTPGEMLGRTPFEFMPPDEARRVAAIYARAADTCEPFTSLGNTVLHKNGTPVVLETSGVPFFDESGALLGYRGIGRDVTERKRAERDLRDSRERLIEAERIARLGNWERDLASSRLTWSEEVYRIFSVDPADFEPTLPAFMEMVHPDDRQMLQNAAADTLRTGQPYNLDHRVVLPDGTERHVHEHAEVVRDEFGVPVRLLGTVQDVTEYKRLEDQLRHSQRMEAVGRLAGGVAHDFNNLLTIISGYTELLMGRWPAQSSERRELEEIAHAAERAASLTRQLLAFSRRQILQLKVLNLNTVVADLDKLLRRLIGEDIELRTLLAPDLGPTKADSTQIEQVVMNLVVNARDAMPEGGRLMIQTANVELDDHYTRKHPEVLPGAYVMIAVSDTGIGMTSNVLAHIFEPFYTTKPRDKGTGLGLSTVYGIVKQSGGSIFVYSEPGQGSTFKVYLPRVEMLTGIVKGRVAPAPVARGHETILVVEDEEGVRMLIRAILESQGYAVLEAQRGKEALQVLAEQPVAVDLMITDVIMPEMSGRELVQHVAALAPEMKVLYISGYTDEAIVHHGVLDAGIPFLQKPFTHDALTRKIRELLDNSMTQSSY